MRKCNGCGYEGRDNEFYYMDETTGKQLVEIYECPQCQHGDIEDMEVDKNKYMAVVLFDVGSDTFYDCCVFVETDGDPKEIAINEALTIINEEYGDADMTFGDSDIQDVLVYEKNNIDRSFQNDLIKGE
jgi:hypothetical protein